MEKEVARRDSIQLQHLTTPSSNPTRLHETDSKVQIEREQKGERTPYVIIKHCTVSQATRNRI